MRGEVYRKVLLMVGELHKRGYERLRISPGVARSGVYWRCFITFAGNDGKVVPPYKEEDLKAFYTSALEDAYFGWEDTAGATVSQLADKFIERFPQICARAKGLDPAYAAWYQEMLRRSEPNGLPVTFADYDLPQDCIRIAFIEPPIPGGKIPDICIPFPPPPSEAGDF